MALFNVSVWQRSRFTLQCFIINLLGSLAWLSAVALAQFEWSEGVSGSVSIPDVAFTCLGNLAVFMTAFTRGRLDVENGARDVLATTRGPKLRAIDGFGLTTLRARNMFGVTTSSSIDLRAVDVVLLSKYKERPHSSLTQFMQYISHSHALESILLQFFPFTSAQGSTAGRCKCVGRSVCRCVVFGATKGIMNMLDALLPGTLKRLPEGTLTRLPEGTLKRLLPSLSCLENKCHECNQAAGESSEPSTSEGRSEPSTSEGRLGEDNTRVDSPAAVCEALNESLTEEEESSCICIPVHPRNADRWTKFMIKFLKSKEKEAKGIKVVVSDALQHYITHSAQELGLLSQTLTGRIVVSEIYESASLILPRVAEVIVNMGLTGWLKVDGFSSSLVARRAIRDYVVDSTGTGFAANAFLTEAVVLCSADRTNACSVLFFRGGILTARWVSCMVGCVNLICSITWSVLIAYEGNWAPSTPLSTARLAVIIGAIGVALAMDCFEVCGGKVRASFWARAEAQAQAEAVARAEAEADAVARERDGELGLGLGLGLGRFRPPVRARARALGLGLDMYQALARPRYPAWVWGLVAVVFLEVGCIVSLVVRLSMKKELGRWVYSGIQALVWVKWGIGSFLLGDRATEGEDGSPYFRIRNRGTWVYCSAFLLNAMLAGVRGKWVYSINK